MRAVRSVGLLKASALRVIPAGALFRCFLKYYQGSSRRPIHRFPRSSRLFASLSSAKVARQRREAELIGTSRGSCRLLLAASCHSVSRTVEPLGLQALFSALPLWCLCGRGSLASAGKLTGIAAPLEHVGGQHSTRAGAARDGHDGDAGDSRFDPAARSQYVARSGNLVPPRTPCSSPSSRRSSSKARFSLLWWSMVFLSFSGRPKSAQSGVNCRHVMRPISRGI